MTYWEAVKRVALGWLTAWKFIPHHLRVLLADSREMLASLILSVARLWAILLCLAMPLLFWLAPVVTPLSIWLIRREEANRAKARAEIEKAQRGMKFKAQEGWE